MYLIFIFILVGPEPQHMLQVNVYDDINSPFNEEWFRKQYLDSINQELHESFPVVRDGEKPNFMKVKVDVIFEEPSDATREEWDELGVPAEDVLTPCQPCGVKLGSGTQTTILEPHLYYLVTHWTYKEENDGQLQSHNNTYWVSLSACY